ncbi:dihydropteroate synthase [Dialister sp.]|uniref:dihydropteroate synthase n=1 Tax=Dialister sp. TaxID=1955814 RepID=UPI003F0BFF5D
MERQHRRYEWKDGKVLELGEKSLVMGILNVTPDSFSDGGRWNSDTMAVSHTTDMIRDGADIIDVGAESTRPGSQALTAEEETERLMQFLPDVLKLSMVPVSVDSYHYQTMEKALQAGAHMVNDIWGFQYDDGSMAKVAAAFDVPVILMHNQKTEEYSEDIIEDLKHFFDKSIEIALSAGVKTDKIILDPGIGFAKKAKENMEILTRLDELTLVFPCPWLLGVSRKRFIGTILGTDASERDEGTAAVNLWGALKGCTIFRVHDVKTTARELKMWDALRLFPKEGM